MDSSLESSGLGESMTKSQESSGLETSDDISTESSEQDISAESPELGTTVDISAESLELGTTVDISAESPELGITVNISTESPELETAVDISAESPSRHKPNLHDVKFSVDDGDIVKTFIRGFFHPLQFSKYLAKVSISCCVQSLSIASIRRCSAWNRQSSRVKVKLLARGKNGDSQLLNTKF